MSPRKGNSLILMLCFFFISILFLNGGCLRKPYLPGTDRGTLRLRIRTAEKSVPAAELSFMSLKEEDQEFIKDLRILLTNQKLTEEKYYSYQEGAEITIDSLYPGTWKIQVYGLNPQQIEIFYGEASAIIDPGETVAVSMDIRSAPGRVEVTMDVSILLDKGYDCTSGKFYVYKDPATNISTSFSLSLEGIFLKNSQEISLPKGTYATRINIPQVTNAIYESHYGSINVYSGKVTPVNLSADANLIIDGIIDATPPTPENFQVSLVNGQAYLTWDSVLVSDLAGYNIYRSNQNGRFILHFQVGPEVLSYIDLITETDFFSNRLGYAVSSFDLGGNNSIWTELRYLDL